MRAERLLPQSLHQSKLAFLIENRIPRHFWLKTYIRSLINSWTHSSSSITAELQLTLMKKCTIFSDSSLFHRSLTFARTSSSAIVTHCRMKSNSRFGAHILTHWRADAIGFSRKHNTISGQWLRHPNPYHTFLHCQSILWANTLVASIRCSNNLRRYTLPYYNVELPKSIT